ncbi:MAG: M16 family metallopeptidase, partial [Novipirellula sp. JB048]
HEHLESPSSQTHIGFSFDGLPFGHPQYFKLRAAIGILSDGMSSRLFDRVREQRGLCYTITAGCHSLENRGAVFGYAGTTPERAQQTLDVTLGEFERFVEDLGEDELERWKVRIQSNLIMEQESSAARASSIASDYFQLGRVLSTAQLEQMIESLSLEQIRDYWLAHRPTGYRIVTLGPQPLSAPQGSTAPPLAAE